MNTVQFSVEIPQTAFAALREDPQTFMAEMRLAAAVKWYEMGRISQEKAAEIAGISRAQFIGTLARFQVSPFQYTAAEVIAESQ
jgi:predicted HTH domain antitoxin